MSSTQRPLIRPMKTGDTAERLEARRRAAELRTIAEDMVDEDCRVVLLRVAQSYEQLAARGDVEPQTSAEPRRQSAWPLKFRASAAAPLTRSIPHRTA